MVKLSLGRVSGTDMWIINQIANDALAAARKMQEPCIWVAIDSSCPGETLYETCGDHILWPDSSRMEAKYCFRCGRRVEYKEG